MWSPPHSGKTAAITDLQQGQATAAHLEETTDGRRIQPITDPNNTVFCVCLLQLLQLFSGMLQLLTVKLQKFSVDYDSSLTLYQFWLNCPFKGEPRFQAYQQQRSIVSRRRVEEGVQEETISGFTECQRKRRGVQPLSL